MRNIATKNSLLINFAAVALGVVIIPLASAVEQSTGFYIAPTLNFHVLDRDLNLDSTFGNGLELGYQFNNKWGVEFSYENVDTQNASDTEVMVDYYHFNGMYNFDDKNGSGLIPYIQFGLGHIDYSVDVKPEIQSDDTSVDLGMGLKYQPMPNVQIRTGIRAIAGVEEHTVDSMIDLGVGYLFGSPKVIPKPVVVEPVPVPVVVPKPVEVVAAPAPAPVVVLPPADGDKDGVVDSNDKCLDTKAGALVDATGCYIILTENKDFTLDVKFKTGSSELDASTKGSIADLAKFLTSYAQTTVVIEGHTDSKGSASSNKSLSQKRADSVRNSLIKDYGTDASRVTAVGYGLEKPIADNATEAGRAQNRRVVAKVQASVNVIKQ